MFAAIAAGLGGCGGNGPIDDIPVLSASLSDVKWSGGEIILGNTDMVGNLQITDTSGVNHIFRVEMSGPTVGAVLDLGSVDLTGLATITLPAGKTLKGSDLLGSYTGTKEAAHVILGVEGDNLTNSAGVRLSGSAIDLGFGVFFGAEFLNMSVIN